MYPKQFIDALSRSGINFFTGVPDSLLKDFLAYIEQEVPHENHITAANEGGAIGIATGYHLATGKVPAVYMQNSGLGNAANPLTSLADKEVYSIPMVLIIGWRGEPGIKDEPQHIKQGRITTELLKTLGIPYTVMKCDMSAQKIAFEIARIAKRARKENRPTALVISNGTFETYKALPHPNEHSLTRENAIEIIIDSLGKKDIVVSTTGKISRELYEVRKKRGNEGQSDFLTVGSMGHAAQIALGIAHQKKNRQVYCLDGDGATIMHMGGLSTIGWIAPNNFKHIVLNNYAYESVGGQPSAARVTDLAATALANNYTYAARVKDRSKLIAELKKLKTKKGPAFLEIIVNLESRKDLGRPEESPVENKKKFMRFLGG
ncbi:MAG: phosphonopyruvate decarboxylase [bacterium]|nr:phosphonopyruvate decarboxylase [bacterium]